MCHSTQIARFTVVAVSSLALLLGMAGSAGAQEQSTIREPGAHLQYPVEFEPHFDAFYASPYDGIGVGGRFSIPVVRNGFVRTINNNVAVSFGLDWLHNDGCFPNNCVGHDALLFPVAMQWNFFLSKHWSVFGEPGFAVGHTLHGAGACAARDVYGNLIYVDCGPTSTDVLPVFMAGARYQFADHFALTMRGGYPGFSIGGSFM